MCTGSQRTKQLKEMDFSGKELRMHRLPQVSEENYEIGPSPPESPADVQSNTLSPGTRKPRTNKRGIDDVSQKQWSSGALVGHRRDPFARAASI